MQSPLSVKLHQIHDVRVSLDISYSCHHVLLKRHIALDVNELFRSSSFGYLRVDASTFYTVLKLARKQAMTLPFSW